MTSDDDPASRAGRRSRTAGPREWQALVRTRANVLVHGNRRALDAFLEAVRPILREPVSIVACTPALALAEASTIVLNDVERLDQAGQRALRAWIADERHAESQIIALTVKSLFALVEKGLFDRELYYMVNTIYLPLPRA